MTIRARSSFRTNLPVAIGRIVFATLLLLGAAAGPFDGISAEENAAGSAIPASLSQLSPPCPVTQPAGNTPWEVGEGIGGYSNDALWTNLWMWGEGWVHAPLDHMMPDGSFVDLKWAWFRFARGDLTIEGRRLDRLAPPLKAVVPDGYGDIGFQVSGITFPTEGCWEVTGRLGDASLTFVTLVLREDRRARDF